MKSMSQSEYKKAFLVAERHIKQSEKLLEPLENQGYKSVVKGLLFPAVNELRYAAYHAIQAFDEVDSDAKEESWVSAKKHCLRASYDALDAQVQFLLGECAIFQKDYRMIVIGEVVSDYQNDCKTIDRINKSDISRVNYSNRENYWEELEIQISQLVPICDKWRVGREELNKILKRERRKFWFNTIAAIGGITTLIATVITIISKWF